MGVFGCFFKKMSIYGVFGFLCRNNGEIMVFYDFIKKCIYSAQIENGEIMVF